MKVKLRKFLIKDATRLRQLFLNEKELAHTGVNVKHEKITLDFVKDWLKEYIDMYSADEPSFLSYAIINEKGEYIGNVGMGNIDYTNHSAEIGYWISKDYTGKGYGTMAVKLFLKNVPKLFGVKKIFAEVDKSNVGSRKVLEKCEFKSEGKGIYRLSLL